jgi:type 1 glutamine amidotransferase
MSGLAPAPRIARVALIFILATGSTIACSPATNGPGSTVGTGGATGTGGMPPPASGSGGAGSGGATGSGGPGPGGQNGGTGGRPTPSGAPDAGTSAPIDATATPAAGQRILLNMLSTSFRHPSEVPASQVLRDKLTALGFTVQIASDAALFTDAGLAPFKVVVMVQASGQPAGAAAGVEALTRFVRNGGGLVGFHGASIIGYPANVPYEPLLGGSFAAHPGDIRLASCEGVGTHPSVARLAMPFDIRDEIYTFNGLNPQNQVVLLCSAFGGGAPIPLSWFRNEGSGRVFYTGLGHGNELWTPTSPLVNDHVLPAILWAAGQ